MQAHSSRSRRPLLLVAVLLAWALLAQPAGAASTTKPYTLGIEPASVPAGTQAEFKATFTNPSTSQQQLGSAELTAPSQLRLISASIDGIAREISGSKVVLRNLALQPGSSVIVTIVADVACSPAELLPWTVVAKQANDFNGAGNNLTPPATLPMTTITGQCRLRFVESPDSQPKNARVRQPLSATPYGSEPPPAPPAPPVAVEVVDGSDRPVITRSADISAAGIQVERGPGSGAGNLLGTTRQRAVDGLAKFSDLSLDAPGIYTLTAKSVEFPELLPVASKVFRVDTVAKTCPVNLACPPGSLSIDTTTVDVFASPVRSAGLGFLTLSFNSGPSIDCSADYTHLSADTALVDVTGGGRTKTVRLTIDKVQINETPNNGASSLQFCFGAPVRFATRPGSALRQQGTYDWYLTGGTLLPGGGLLLPAVYVGLLPDCGKYAPPCVSARRKTGAGDGVIEARLPAELGDPAMRG